MHRSPMLLAAGQLGLFQVSPSVLHSMQRPISGHIAGSRLEARTAPILDTVACHIVYRI